jgi:protease IV
MKRLVCLAAWVSLLVGCGDAYLVRPIFYEEGLVERVVDDSDGAMVWNKVLIVEVDGLIACARQPGLFSSGENPVSLVKEKLRMAEKDSRVRAIILRVNSPGGTVTASDIIYRELKAFRNRTGRPIVALLMDVAASGGYYAACAADTIVAHPTTLTGSIGVIMQWLNVSGAMAMLQVRVETIKSGGLKDIGSPFRQLTREEQKILQGIVNGYHKQFVDVVAASRPDLSIEQARKLADGRVYAAREALEHGLVDKLGYMDDALAAAKRLAGIDKAKVVTYGRQHRPGNTAYAHAPAGPSQFNLLNIDVSSLAHLQQPRFMYLWAPGAQ